MQAIKDRAKELCQHSGDKAPPDPYLHQYHMGVELWVSDAGVSIFKNPVDGVWLATSEGVTVAFDRYYGALPMIDFLAKVKGGAHVCI
jgi:hypothetical protein